MELFNTQDDWKPWIKRPSSWIIIAMFLVAGLIGVLSADAIKALEVNFATEIAELPIERIDTVYKIHVSKWTAIREYNRSLVPNCAWDIESDTYYVCDSRDTLGNCLSGHYETDYDYNVMDWADFTDWTTTNRYPDLEVFSDRKKFKVHVSDRKYIYLYSIRLNEVKKFNLKFAITGNYIRVKRRKKSKKILKLLKN